MSTPSRGFTGPTRVYGPAPDLVLIREACWREEALAIHYADRGHVVTERTVWPLAIAYADHTLSMLAWCTLRQGFRIFRPERVLAAHPTGESFRPKRAALLREYLAELNGRLDTEGGSAAAT